MKRTIACGPRSRPRPQVIGLELTRDCQPGEELLYKYASKHGTFVARHALGAGHVADDDGDDEVASIAGSSADGDEDECWQALHDLAQSMPKAMCISGDGEDGGPLARLQEAKTVLHWSAAGARRALIVGLRARHALGPAGELRDLMGVCRAWDSEARRKPWRVVYRPARVSDGFLLGQTYHETDVLAALQLLRGVAAFMR